VAQAGRQMITIATNAWPVAGRTSCWAATLRALVEAVESDESIDASARQLRSLAFAAMEG
jgi:hypothetical protein